MDKNPKNNFKILSIVVFIILSSATFLILKFFDINFIYFLPYLGWFGGIVIFYNVLDSDHKNIFIK